MKTITQGIKKYWVIILAASILASLISVKQTSAACVVPTTNYGIATSVTSVPAAANYRVWVRLMAPDTASNSVLFEIDDGTCITVGDSTSIPANTWTWVNYQGGNTTSTINANLTAGQHSIKIIGHERGVKVDRVILTADTSCVPSNTKTTDGSVGGNCATPPDTTPPTVAISSPVDNSTHSTTVNVAVNAADDTGGSGIDRVELYVGARFISNDTTAPYNLSVDPTTLTAGLNTLTVRAFDRAGNSSSDSVPINVVVAGPQDTQAPTIPANLTAVANAQNRVTVSWNASTDNVAVTGYYVQRGGVTIATVTSGITYVDSAVNASTTYAYRIVAFDAARNNSAASTTVNVTTPAIPDTTAPSTPTGLSANIVGSTQANLVWSVSTDNIGVKEYDVYRSTSTGTPTKIATVATSSFGNTGLSASTTYNYYVIARDAAGNNSTPSTIASITTPVTPPPATTTGSVIGTVSSSNGGVIKGAKINIVVNGVKRTIVTASNGTYNLANVTPGNYSLKYNATKHLGQSHNVAVVSGQSTIKNVTLQKR